MGDSELYGWARVWLNRLEQDWASWENEEEKVRFRHPLVWHLATSASSAPSTSVVSGAQKQPKLGFAYNALARPGMKARPSMRGVVPMRQPIAATPCL